MTKLEAEIEFPGVEPTDIPSTRNSKLIGFVLHVWSVIFSASSYWSYENKIIGYFVRYLLKIIIARKSL